MARRHITRFPTSANTPTNGDTPAVFVALDDYPAQPVANQIIYLFQGSKYTGYVYVGTSWQPLITT